MDGRGALSILPVHDRRDLKRFLGVTREVYKHDPVWVQPLTLERLDHLNPKKNPFLRAIEIAFWTVARGPTPVGRISALVNRAHLERHDDATGHFGFFECEDDPEAARLLTETAEIWLRAKGMRRIMGPFSPSINDECGLLVDGFDTAPAMMMPHGRPHYDRLLRDLDYEQAKDLIAYDMDVRAPLPEAMRRLMERAGAKAEIVVRHLDEKRYGEEIRLICDIFNDAWADNWGFVPFGGAEAQYLAKSIRPLVRADSFVIGEYRGEPAAMGVTLPDLNEAAAGLDGRLLPFGWAKLLWRLKAAGVKRARMPLMGVKKRLQGTPAGAALALAVLDRAKRVGAERGFEWAELSWVLEDNRKMRGLIEAAGIHPYKTYRLYAKAIA